MLKNELLMLDCVYSVLPHVQLTFAFQTIQWYQCVKQTSRMSCQALIEGVIGRGTTGGLVAQTNFFFGLLSNDQFSYRI
jgi:hypothetical protein